VPVGVEIRRPQDLVLVNVELFGADLGGFGADEGRLGTNQSRLGALASNAGTGDRLALDRARVLEVRLVGGWKLEHRSRFVERHLLHVSPFLGVVECFLTDIPGRLLAIDPRLAISEDAILALVPARAALALVILDELLAIDA
jgi:hypothetical protein